MTDRTSRRRLWSLGLLLMVCALTLVLAGPAAPAQAKDWRVANMDVVLQVQENGDVLVDETVTFAFEGNYHFVSMSVPTANYMGITDVEVRDASGAILPEGDTPGTYSRYSEGDTQFIQVNFDLTDTAGTWVFHYRGKQVVQFGDPQDGLEWYVFDAETPVPIDHAKVTVKLPGSIASEKMTTDVLTDDWVQWTVTSPAASTVVYEASGFGPYGYFWTVTGFPRGMIENPWTARRVFNYVIPKFGLFLPFLAFLTMFLIWFKRGRDQPGAVYAKYVSEPPSDLSPALVGALIDERVDTKEVIATIVDLAKRGYLEIADEQEGKRFAKPADYLHPQEVFRRSRWVREEDLGVALLAGFERYRDHYSTEEPLLQQSASPRERDLHGGDHGRVVLQESQQVAFPLDRVRVPRRRHLGRADLRPRQGRDQRLGLFLGGVHHIHVHRVGLRAPHAPAHLQRRAGAEEVAGLPQLLGRPHSLHRHGSGQGEVREVPSLCHRLRGGEAVDPAF